MILCRPKRSELKIFYAKFLQMRLWMNREIEEKLKFALQTIDQYLGEKDIKVIGTRESDKSELVKLAQIIRKNVLIREEILPDMVPASPVWRLLIEMYIAKYQGRGVSITDAALLVNIPLTTTLRYLKILEDKGILQRDSDRHDKRRAWLRLREKGILIVERSLRRLAYDIKEFLS